MRAVFTAVQFHTVGEALSTRRTDLAVTNVGELLTSLVRRPLLCTHVVRVFDPRLSGLS